MWFKIKKFFVLLSIGALSGAAIGATGGMICLPLWFYNYESKQNNEEKKEVV